MKIDNTLPLEYQTEENSNRIFGFWLFLGAEIVLFSTLFAVYLTLWTRSGNGPTAQEIFQIKPVLLETFLLLTSSFTCGLAIHSMRLSLKKPALIFFAITLLLGLGFLGIEIYEFVTYVHEGATLQTSAFLSSLFVLLGTHGAHVTLGLLWGSGLMIQIKREGFTRDTANKSFIFSLYWHFLDVVWIFIFSFVYLKGLM
ncbi:cytochrome aa3 quinol oxidase subunit III [Paenibacillus apiarius]|uniref:Quinol oxidase subunit 3 n=1 Tax=Paenibacillus apiarius TaxID=46240 RepID=A0ABT4DU01_9BACL|nr:cytochrome aa3 quinol oxidase subunit III [Paenibacillus apiarius]MBN3524194.1 cytochrome aa3 quinol oxidase subunit III [Paenibacillus apiarius]MCY9513979.1 cytochrome aa3 quinol oxidase subunit III [Paenibacillus apiarius]MCY9519496.1 cytochrome aa3 quinol oxidase subunit III [Paenibacillus apiarius]MCY9552423.1 cytochrome aa3 quinol oxidase subunit III [Paenibacillus apiarius]MCY9556252.1 cytochrome aa3 quinol oxidase subunit III [Paenibacillus apiarius]